MQTKSQIISAAISAMEKIRAEYVPNIHTRYKTSTGNMAFNSLQSIREGDTFIIYMNQAIAPYVPYTNEPWISSYWKGKKNPNEGWWQDRFVPKYAETLANKLNGVLVK